MIFIDKTLTTPSGVVVSHHQVVKAELSSDGSGMNLIGHAWASSAQRLEGMDPVERWGARIPVESLNSGSGVLADVATWLISFGPLIGGTIIPPAEVTLEDAKTLRWAEMKRLRDEIEYGGFEWDGSRFDSDETSRARIMGAVTLAVIAATNGFPYAQDWTLEDDTVRTLSATDMINVGVAFGQHVSAAFETARVLREAIDAATTVEEVQAVVWPSDT